MNLREFSAVNLDRCIKGFGHELDSWNTAEWTNAVAGEVGEACNNAKKLLRLRDNVKGNDPFLTKGQLKRKVAEELADVFIYVDLAIQSLGFETSDIVKEVFNRKSDDIDCPIKYMEKV